MGQVIYQRRDALGGDSAAVSGWFGTDQQIKEAVRKSIFNEICTGASSESLRERSPLFGGLQHSSTEIPLEERGQGLSVRGQPTCPFWRETCRLWCLKHVLRSRRRSGASIGGVLLLSTLKARGVSSF